MLLLLALWFPTGGGPAYAQTPSVQGSALRVVATYAALPIEEICQLHPAAHRGNFYFRVPEQPSGARKTAAATISVTYDAGFTGNPDAQAAFQRAVDTWASLITSPVTINVSASFSALAPGVLGSAGPNGSLGLTSFGDGINRILGMPLAEKVIGSNQNGAAADITATFSSSFTDWHFGTGAPPVDKIDFESVVLHELGHGLNFSRRASVDDGAGGAECTGVAGVGCMLESLSGTDYYGVNDAFFMDGSSVLLRTTATYTDPSSGLGDALRGQAGGVFFSGSNATTANGGTEPRLYAPAVFASGSSLSHLDETTYNGTQNALMTPSIADGEVLRAPGPVTCGVMEDILWTVDQVTCAALALPVELVSFEALADGRDVVLVWETASETDNAGFEVEQQAGDGAFERVGFVEGRGNAQELQRYDFLVADVKPGRHVFRLRQVDYDGTFAYSPEVEVVFGVPEGYRVSDVYPNPFNPQAQFTVAVGERQQVRVELFNVMGQRVGTVYEGSLEANTEHSLRIEAGDLPSGLYLVRVTAERFNATRRVLLMK